MFSYPFFFAWTGMKKKKDQLLKDKELLRTRVKNILKTFRNIYPYPRCHLNYSNPFQLLIGCILSAQCTDKRVNEITKDLFRKYRTPEEFSRAGRKSLEEDIHSAGFFRNKAKSIINCAKEIVEKYNGEVPLSVEDLTKLSGVGRKTANVVRGNAYGKPGIIVDTHIKRLSGRIGLTKFADPVKIEYDLMELVPEKEWTYFSNALGDHGREICVARKPKCVVCKINDQCPSAYIFLGKTEGA